MAYNAQPFVGDKYLSDAGQKSAALDLSGTEALGEGIKDAGKAVGEFLKSSKALKDENEYLTSQYEAMAEIGKELMPQAFGDEAIGKFHTMGLNQKRGHVAQMGSFMNTYLNEKIAKDAAAQGYAYDLGKIGATGQNAKDVQQMENQNKKEIAQIAAAGENFVPFVSTVTQPDGSKSWYYHKPKGQGVYEPAIKTKFMQQPDDSWHIVNERDGSYIDFVKSPNDPTKPFIGKHNVSADEVAEIFAAGQQLGSGKDKQDARINGQKGGAVPLKTPEASASPSATPNIGKMPLSQIPKGASYKQNGEWKIKE